MLNKKKERKLLSLEYVLEHNALTVNIEEFITEGLIEKQKKVILKMSRIYKKNPQKTTFRKKEIEKIEKDIFTKEELYIEKIRNKYKNVVDRLYDLEIFLLFFEKTLSGKTEQGKTKERAIKFLLDKYNVDQASLFEKILSLVREIFKINMKRVNGTSLKNFLGKIKEKNLNIFNILNKIDSNLINGDVIFRKKNISTRKNQNDFKHNDNHSLMDYIGWDSNYIDLIERTYDFKIINKKQDKVMNSFKKKNDTWYTYSFDLLNELSKYFSHNICK